MEPDPCPPVTDLGALGVAVAKAMQSAASDADGALSAVCLLCIAAMPVDGGAFTVMGSDATRQTVAASDAVAAALEESQFVLGEGPTLDAFASRRPVAVHELTTAASHRWPMFQSAVNGLPLGSLYAMPMHLGAITVGVWLLYRREVGVLSPTDLATVLGVIDLATSALLAIRAGQPVPPPEPPPALDRYWLDGGQFSRRQVHQATGMLIVQLGVTAEEAFAVLRAYCFASDRLIERVADDIVSHRLYMLDHLDQN